MALSKDAADQLAELVHDFNPGLKVKVNSGTNEVIATAEKLQLTGQDMQTLAEITKDTNVTFDRSGANFRMIIN